MSDRTCSVDGCQKNWLARGMCSTHYAAYRRACGGVLPPLPTSRCAVDGCTNKHHAHGYCSNHYARLRRWGDPLGEPPVVESRVCSVDGCNASHWGRDLCRKHYRRWKATGRVDLPPRPSLADRFWSKIDQGDPSECWLWTAGTDRHGYGKFQLGGGRVAYAPRLAVELSTGEPIPAGLVVRHQCDNPPCCNPAHLVVGTQLENIQDMVKRGRGWWQRNGAA